MFPWRVKLVTNCHNAHTHRILSQVTPWYWPVTILATLAYYIVVIAGVIFPKPCKAQNSSDHQLQIKDNAPLHQRRLEKCKQKNTVVCTSALHNTQYTIRSAQHVQRIVGNMRNMYCNTKMCNIQYVQFASLEHSSSVLSLTFHTSRSPNLAASSQNPALQALHCTKLQRFLTLLWKHCKHFTALQHYMRLHCRP